MTLLRPLPFLLFSLASLAACGGRVATEPVTVEDTTVTTTGLAITNWFAGQTSVSLQTTTPLGTQLRVLASLGNAPSGTYELRPEHVDAKTPGLASCVMTRGDGATWTAESGTLTLEVSGGWHLKVHVDAILVREDDPHVIHLVTDTTVSMGTT
jgi:hypothetical protein